MQEKYNVIEEYLILGNPCSTKTFSAIIIVILICLLCYAVGFPIQSSRLIECY